MKFDEKLLSSRNLILRHFSWENIYSVMQFLELLYIIILFYLTLNIHFIKSIARLQTHAYTNVRQLFPRVFSDKIFYNGGYHSDKISHSKVSKLTSIRVPARPILKTNPVFDDAELNHLCVNHIESSTNSRAGCTLTSQS